MEEWKPPEVRTKIVKQQGEVGELVRRVSKLPENHVVNVVFSSKEDHQMDEECACEPQVYVQEDKATVIVHNYLH